MATGFTYFVCVEGGDDGGDVSHGSFKNSGGTSPSVSCKGDGPQVALTFFL